MPEWITDPRIIIAGAVAIGGVGYWVGQVNSDRESFKEFMKKIEKKIDEIFDRLPPRVIAGASPVRLTEFGRKAAKDSGMDKISRQVAPDLLAHVKGMEPFQIHEYCVQYVKELPERESAAVAKGAYDLGLSKEDMGMVLGVLLRDELLRILEETASEGSVSHQTIQLACRAHRDIAGACTRHQPHG